MAKKPAKAAADKDPELQAIEDDAALLATIQARYKAAREKRGGKTGTGWAAEAKTMFDFYASRQWSEDDIASLESQQRPVITFNRAAVLIDAVVGYEVNNRQETRYIPRTQGDAKVNEEITQGSKFFRDECDAEFEESDAFRDMLICGMGWTNDRLDQAANPDYDLVRERVDPFEMMWDPSAIKPNLADARFLMRKKWMAKDECRQLFPDFDEDAQIAEWLADDAEDDDNEGGGHNNPRNHYKGAGADEQGANRDIPTLEYQWMVLEDRWEVEHPETKKKIYLDDEKLAAEKATFEKLVPLGMKPPKKVKKAIYRRAFVCNGEIARRDDPAPFPNGFSYHCITGMRDRNKGHWFGMMRRMKDPQEWSNKWLAQTLHILNSGAKPGYDIEEGAVKDIAAFESKAAKPGAVNVFAADAMRSQRMKYRNPPVMPAGFDKLIEYANKSFGDVTGVNQELLGMADREQPGVLEYQRKQSAVTLLAPLFDSLRRYRKISGRCWLYMLDNYVSDGRLVRITTDDGEGYQPFSKRPDIVEYDVIIDQASSAPNQKEATWAVVTQMLPIIGERLGPDEIQLLLEYSPLPASLQEKLKKLKKEQEAKGPQKTPDQQKLEADMAMKKQQLEFDMQKATQDGQIEQQKNASLLQLKQGELAAEIKMNGERLAADLALQKQKLAGEQELARQKAIDAYNLAVFEAENAARIEDAKSTFSMKLAGENAAHKRSLESANGKGATA